MRLRIAGCMNKDIVYYASLTVKNDKIQQYHAISRKNAPVLAEKQSRKDHGED